MIPYLHLWPATVCLTAALFFTVEAANDVRLGFAIEAAKGGGMALICWGGAVVAFLGAVL